MLGTTKVPLVLGALAVGMALPAPAQEFKPYPRAHITQEQWQAHHDEVKAKLGTGVQDIESEKLEIFQDRNSGTTIAFTKPGHPAHPAWVTRQVREKDGTVGIAQIGYFAGAEAPFAKLFRDYQQLNDRIRQSVQSKSAASSASSAGAPK